MNAKDMTEKYFTSVILPRCQFTLMNADDKEAFAGAGKFCLMANVEFGSDYIVLAEQGKFNIYGFNDEGNMWCFSLFDNGRDSYFSQLF
jgi:hypothetical protein